MKPPEGTIWEFVAVIICCVLVLWAIQLCGPYSHYIRPAISSGSAPLH